MLQKQKLKNSKKGFSLPMAMAISVFLIIIATSLIYISMQSLSTTSVDISGRQAYLNVRSALEYAQSYYSNNVTDYSTIKTEYMIMNDKSGGTTDQGAKITKSSAETKDCVTYVEVVFTAAKDSQPAELKLSAYSKYSDAFGNRAKTAHLSVTFTVGAAGPNRLTIIQSDHTEKGPVSAESITINVKKPKGYDQELVYYVWTYEDLGHAYDNYDEENGDLSYTYDAKVKADGKSTGSAGEFSWDEFVNRMNTSTKVSVKPNAEWMTTEMLKDPKYKASEQGLVEGPNGIMSNDGSGWVTGEYFIKNGRVPWFNIIFAKMGSTLAGEYGATNIYDTQTNEIFHLWYLDPGDKNVYIEFFDVTKSEKDEYGVQHDNYYTKYFRGYWKSSNGEKHPYDDWDGKKGLEDTVLVYVKNPKTTVHFRIEGQDDTTTSSVLSDALKPHIDSIDGVTVSGESFMHSGNKYTGMDMEYEGCGWWVANVETNDTFGLTISFNGMTRKVSNIPANTENNEFWIIYTTIAKGEMALVVRDEESVALADLGVDPNSYVTVHAKIYDYTTKPDSNPVLIYGNVALNSSTGRINLLNEIVEAWSLKRDDYTDESLAQLDKVVEEALEMVNNEDFINDQKDADGNDTLTPDEKVIQADLKYDEMTQKLDDTVRHLKPKKLTQSDLENLTELVAKADEAVTTNRQDYDVNYMTEFLAKKEDGSDSSYDKAKKILNDPTGKTRTDISNVYSELETDFNKLLQGYLNRAEFRTLINLCDQLKPRKEDYRDKDEYGNPIDPVGDFNSALQLAKNTVDLPDLTKGAFTLAYDGLAEARQNLEKYKKSVLDTVRLSNLLADARKLLPANDAEKKNCTDESYDKLYKAYQDGLKGLDDTDVQEQAQINAYADALEKAIDDYIVVKPSKTIAELAKDNITRVWVYFDDSVQNRVSHLIFNAFVEGSGITATSLKDENTPWANVLYYQDVPANFKSVSVTTIDVEGNEKNSTTINIEGVADRNIVFYVDDQGNITNGKLVTVYADFEGEVVAKLGAKELPCQREDGAAGGYFETRYMLTEENKDDQLKFVVTTRAEDPLEPDIVTTYVVGALTEGEYVAIPEEGKNRVKLLKVNDIYPKFYNPITNPEPAPESSEPKSGGAWADDDVEIMGMREYADVDFIYFTDNDDGFGIWANPAPYAYFFKNNKTVGAEWPGTQMTYFRTNSKGQKEYKIIPPDNAEYVIFSAGYSSKQTANIKYEMGYEYYKTGVVGNPANVGSVQIGKSYTQPNMASSYMYFTNNLNWENLHCYWYSGNGAKGPEWPGYVGTESYKNSKGQTVYVFQEPQNASHFIINNGGAGGVSMQSTDGNQNHKYYYFTGKSKTDKQGRTVWEITKGKSDGEGSGGSAPETVDAVTTTNLGGTTIGGGGGTTDEPGFVESDLTGTEVPMVYVGGFKVRVTNQSYADVYGDNKKTNSAGYSYSADMIYFTDNKGYGTVKAFFLDSNKHTLGAAWPGTTMDYYATNSSDQKVYSIVPPEGACGVIFNNGDNQQTVDIVNSEISGMYNPGSPYQVEYSTGQAYYCKNEYIDGKRKVGTWNASDMKWTPDDDDYIRSTHRFGGNGRNDGSSNRLGMAKLTPYYDWYEFKIPVSRKAEYSFSVKGLDPTKPSVQTKIVDHAHGDIWLEMLSNYNGGSGHFQNYYLYTFDPDKKENVSDTTMTIFYQKPAGWDTPKVTVTGPFIADADPVDMKQVTTGSDIYYIDNVKRDSPFIAFTCVETYIEGSEVKSRSHYHVTELAGGDKVLFVPNDTVHLENGSYTDSGEWVNYVSAQEQLKRDIASLRAAFYGNNIPSSYNEKGEVVADTVRNYSQGLRTEFLKYCKEEKNTNGNQYYITNDYSTTNASTCASYSASIRSVLNSYTKLYSAIRDARQYLTSTLTDEEMPSDFKIHGEGGGYYPEYLNRASPNRQYTSDSIKTLRKYLGKAEAAYLGNNNTTTVEQAYSDLQRAVSGLTIEREGSIAVVLFDAQGKVKDNSSFKIRFRTSKDGDYNEPITLRDYNPERYPIIFLSPSDIGNASEIYDVQFIEIDKTGTSKEIAVTRPVMKMDEAWVFVYTKNNPYWSKNTATDYREIRAEVFVQSDDEQMLYKMIGSGAKKEDRVAPYKAMTLLFTKDASVTGGGVDYVIKAGSYTFTNADCGAVDSPISADGILNLYSTEAANYFSHPVNYGVYVDGENDLRGNKVTSTLNVSSLWKDDKGDFVTVATHTPNAEYANFEGSSGSMVSYSATYTRYEFNATKGISFRWSSERPLYTSAEVKMHADEIIFASMGTIDGTKARGAHFYIGKAGAKKMVVDFRTDVFIKYVDLKGDLHTFAIREGKYEIEAADGSNNNYVADLYDETYWKGMEKVHYIGSNTANEGGSGTSGILRNGRYGT